MQETKIPWPVTGTALPWYNFSYVTTRASHKNEIICTLLNNFLQMSATKYEAFFWFCFTLFAFLCTYSKDMIVRFLEGKGGVTSCSYVKGKVTHHHVVQGCGK